jgi:MFS family permease
VLKSLRNTKDFPRAFWVLMVASFVDHIGSFLLLPFFSLYITDKFGVGLTEVGQVFLVFSIAGTTGGILGGAITDRFGRRAIILFGIIFSGLSSILLGFADSLTLFLLLSPLIGLLGDIGGPAQSAMVADLLPEHRQAEGFSIWRVSVNISAILGPLVGGLILAYSNYLYLFIGDAILSLITAVIVYFSLPETRPAPKAGQTEESIGQTFAGYGRVLADRVFMAFILLSMLGVVIYTQMNTTLPVYLRDIHNIPPQGYSFLISLNAVMVVLLQFWITRRARGLPPLVVVAIGTVFYAIGFGMYGFGGGIAYFSLAMAVLTIGEMIVAPSGQALAARFAPADMRGRYMALFGFSWALPFAFGPLAAGYIMDNFNPNWVWWGCAILGALVVGGYLALHARAGSRLGLMGDESEEPAAAPDPSAEAAA